MDGAKGREPKESGGERRRFGGEQKKNETSDGGEILGLSEKIEKEIGAADGGLKAKEEKARKRKEKGREAKKQRGEGFGQRKERELLGKGRNEESQGKQRGLQLKSNTGKEEKKESCEETKRGLFI